jgi:integrase/recombinase XerD
MVRERLDVWIEGYLDYLRDVRRVAKRSLADKRCTFRRVARAMATIRPGVPLWKLSLDDFLVWLTREREAGSTEQTLVKHVSYLRGLLEYTWRSGRAERNPLDRFSLPNKHAREEPRSLTLEEAKQLVDASRAFPRRDRTIVLVLYGCGLRTKELCELDVSDVDIERQELDVRFGKGSRPRRVPVPGGVWTELLAYLTERKGKRGALFRTVALKRRIAEREVSEVVKAAAVRAGLAQDITPKALRHSFGTHLMDRGVDVGVISSLMGHRSPAETGVYLHVRPGRLEAAISKLGQIGG